MFTKQEYYGEVWITQNEKSFCVLKIQNDNIKLITSLNVAYHHRNIEVIYGSFIGLGYVTFINNMILGVHYFTPQKITFQPKYLIVSQSKVNSIDEISIGNQFHIENPGFNETLKFFPAIDYENEIKITVENFIYSYTFDDGLQLSFQNEKSTYNNISLAKIENLACLKFSSKKNIGIGNIKSKYNDFLNLFTLLMGKRIQFTKFSFKNVQFKDWLKFYYNDELADKTESGLYSIDIKENKDEMNAIITNWFQNNKLRDCCDSFFDNVLGLNISMNSRLSNSFSTLEGYVKMFVLEKSIKNVEQYLKSEKSLIQKMTGTNSVEADLVISRILKLRNKIVHKNIVPNLNPTDIEVLYDSMILDYLFLYKVYEILGVNEKDLKRLILFAKDNYTHSKNINQLLYSDYFKN